MSKESQKRIYTALFVSVLCIGNLLMVSGSQDDVRSKRVYNKYYVTPYDTLTVETPSLNVFEGYVNQKVVQVYLIYGLFDVYGTPYHLGRYCYKAIMYVAGYPTYMEGALSSHDGGNTYSGKLALDDKVHKTIYDLNFKRGKSYISIKTENTTESGHPVYSKINQVRESNVKLAAYDRIIYNNFYCKDNLEPKNNLTYSYSYEAISYPALFTKMFGLLNTADFDKWQHVVKLTKPTAARLTPKKSCYSTIKVNYTEPIYLDRKIFVSRMFNYTYTGGAHGNYKTTYAVYNIESGNKLSVSDVLDIDNTAFFFLYQRTIKKYYGDVLFDEVSNKIKPSDNFYILPTGITFVHGLNTIAPYVVGEPSIFIPFDKLRPYLKVSLY